MKTIFRPRAIPVYTFSQTSFFVHLLNEDSSLKQTVCFVPGERKSLPLYNYIISFNLLNMNTLLINTLSMAPSVSVLINRFDCTSKQGRGLHFMYFIALWSIEAKTSFHAILYILQYKLLSFIFHGFIFILEWVITWIITFIQNISLFLIS